MWDEGLIRKGMLQEREEREGKVKEINRLNEGK